MSKKAFVGVSAARQGGFSSHVLPASVEFDTLLAWRFNPVSGPLPDLQSSPSDSGALQRWGWPTYGSFRTGSTQSMYLAESQHISGSWSPLEYEQNAIFARPQIVPAGAGNVNVGQESARVRLGLTLSKYPDANAQNPLDLDSFYRGVYTERPRVERRMRAVLPPGTGIDLGQARTELNWPRNVSAAIDSLASFEYKNALFVAQQQNAMSASNGLTQISLAIHICDSEENYITGFAAQISSIAGDNVVFGPQPPTDKIQTFILKYTPLDVLENGLQRLSSSVVALSNKSLGAHLAGGLAWREFKLQFGDDNTLSFYEDETLVESADVGALPSGEGLRVFTETWITINAGYIDEGQGAVSFLPAFQPGIGRASLIMGQAN